MNQPMSLKFKNYLHITTLHMITFYYWESLSFSNMSFSNNNMRDLCGMFELNYLIKDPTCFKSSNPSYIDNVYTNKKTMFFLIHLLPRQAFLITIVWFVQCFDRHFVKVQQNLYTTCLIKISFKNVFRKCFKIEINQFE